MHLHMSLRVSLVVTVKIVILCYIMPCSLVASIKQKDWKICFLYIHAVLERNRKINSTVLKYKINSYWIRWRAGTDKTLKCIELLPNCWMMQNLWKIRGNRSCIRFTSAGNTNVDSKYFWISLLHCDYTNQSADLCGLSTYWLHTEIPPHIFLPFN